MVQGRDRGRRVPLWRREIPLGRECAGDPVVDGVAFSDPTVSRQHALLVWEEASQHFRLYHVSTTNLTLVNGRPVQDCPLASDDVLQMGELICRVTYAGKTRAAEPAPAPPPPPPASPTTPDREATRVIRRGRAAAASSQAPSPARAGPAWTGWLRLRRRRREASSLAVFYRSMATMYDSGVHTDRALLLLGEQAEDPAMAELALDLCRLVDSGVPLSRGMARWPDVFGPMHQKLVEIGEATGTMGKVLHRLSAYEERRIRMAMRVANALTYPLLLFALGLVMLVLGPPYLFGDMFRLIESLGIDVPLISRVVFAVSKTLGSVWFILPAVAAGIAAVRFLPGVLGREAVRYRLHAWALRAPILGRVLRTQAVTRFARSMEITSEVGVSVTEALRLSFAAAANPVLEGRYEAAVGVLRGGGTLRETLAAANFFPKLLLQVVATGEESGKLPDLLSKLAGIYEAELEQVLESSALALEPLMLLVMGIATGCLVAATMLPLVRVAEMF